MKRDKSVKIELDARAQNNETFKDKYQMPDLKHLVDLVAAQLHKEGNEQVFYTSLDMRYAYGQVPSDKETAKHCNFQFIGGKATGSYRFITGFYGLTVMPTGIQRIITKIQALTEKLKPKSLKELRSFMGAVNHLNRFIPNLAKLCFLLRPLLKKENQ